MLKQIVELSRRTSTSPAPHAVATDGETLWISSRATRRIDVIDPERWEKVGEVDPPGMPWGMAYGDGTVIMTCGENDDDTRRIRRFDPESGFIDGYVDCPDDAGSHMAFANDGVLLGQWYNKRLLVLDATGDVLTQYSAPHEIAGVAVRDGVAYLLGTDDEDHGDYWITRVDLRDRNVPPEDVAVVPFHARGLAWDGKQFWTNHREADQVVSFDLPD
jgi:DNA-binding beta-propeller fold protein YncE